MKHLLPFCFALAIIVISAIQLTPTYEGPTVVYPRENNVQTYTDFHYPQMVAIPLSFSPGTLPDRVTVPKPGKQ